MMRKCAALLLAGLLSAPGCASARGPRLQVEQQSRVPADQTLLAGYLKALPIGSRVRVTFTNGERIHGTLMNVSETEIVVQESTRIPESPRRLPIQTISAVEPHTPRNTARVIAIGAAIGAGAVLGVLLFIAAVAYD
jgi:small nuclear ribonucleoprotein (snRNP)-like protein